MWCVQLADITLQDKVLEFSFQSIIPVCHLRCCQKYQADRKWHCKDLTSRCPTSMNSLVTQQKSLVHQDFHVQLERAEAHCSSSTQGVRQMDREWGDGQQHYRKPIYVWIFSHKPLRKAYKRFTVIKKEWYSFSSIWSTDSYKEEIILQSIRTYFLLFHCASTFHDIKSPGPAYLFPL